MYAKEHGVKVNVVRALNAFGERQKYYPVRKMMPSFITRALKGQDIEVYGDGLQVMDFVYVKDVAKVLLSALQIAGVDPLKDIVPGLQSNTGNIFEAGTGGGLSVKEWAEKVIKLSGSSSQIKHLDMRPGEPVGSSVVAEKPFDFPYTNVDEALTRTIEWYRKNA